MTTAKNPVDGKTEPTKPEVDKNPADGKTEPTKPETDKPETKLADKKPEPVVRHHVQHEAGGQQGSDAPTVVVKWAMAGVLFIALALGLAWIVSSYMNKAPAVATITAPAPPPRMVDVSPPDPTVVYVPTPAPVPDPPYAPTVRKTGKDNWGNSIVTKPTFAEGSK